MSVLPDQHVINQIISGHYADPFSLLGMHSVAAGLEVRALLPDADQVWVIDVEKGKQVAELRRYDDRGFFVGLIPRRKNAFRYQMEVRWGENLQVIDDPYRFGTLLQELDIWLLAEGTHLRPYEKLGAHLQTLDGVEG